MTLTRTNLSPFKSNFFNNFSFQIYFEEHPQLFGWFEYLNNVEIDDKKIKQELSDIRKKLREKLNLNDRLDEDISMEEIGNRIKDLETNMEHKLISLTDHMKSTVSSQS